jgi:hypothetical protein
VTQGAALLRGKLRKEIEDAITGSASAWKKFVDDNRGPIGLPLAMKYVQSQWAKDYLPSPSKPVFPPPSLFAPSPNDSFFIGNKDFTWGKAVYVTGVEEPLSTAIYGRVGLVSWFYPDDPDDPWRVFDARDKDKARLYLDWLNLQKAYPEAILTVHTDHWLHGLRNKFREQFRIDVVLCYPDEKDQKGWYTRPKKDTWACVSDWDPYPPLPGKAKLAEYKYSKRFPDVRLTIVGEEEFVTSDALIRPPLRPHPRVAQLAVSGKRPRVPKAPTVDDAYWNGEIVRIQS